MTLSGFIRILKVEIFEGKDEVLIADYIVGLTVRRRLFSGLFEEG